MSIVPKAEKLEKKHEYIASCQLTWLELKLEKYLYDPIVDHTPRVILYIYIYI